MALTKPLSLAFTSVAGDELTVLTRYTLLVLDAVSNLVQLEWQDSEFIAARTVQIDESLSPSGQEGGITSIATSGNITYFNVQSRIMAASWTNGTVEVPMKRFDFSKRV